MTYLPGTDDAIYPGTNRITANAVVEDDRHLVVLDLSPVAYPADGLIPTLARALADVGLLDALARVRSSHPAVGEALDALASEPSIARTLQITLTPEDAARIACELDAAALEPQPCAWDGCSRYRVDGDRCLVHTDADEDRDVAWDAAS